MIVTTKDDTQGRDNPGNRQRQAGRGYNDELRELGYGTLLVPNPNLQAERGMMDYRDQQPRHQDRGHRRAQTSGERGLIAAGTFSPASRTAEDQ